MLEICRKCLCCRLPDTRAKSHTYFKCKPKRNATMSTLTRKAIQKENDIYDYIRSEHKAIPHSSPDNDGPGSAGNGHDAEAVVRPKILLILVIH